VIAALNHELPDRCPMQVSFTPEFADRLRADLLTDRSRTHNPHGGGNTYELERALDQDLLLTSVGWANSYYQSPGEYTDEWGVTFRPMQYQTPFGTGCYTEPSHPPLIGDTAIAAYRCPDPYRPELYQEAADTVRAYGDRYWIVGVTVCTVFETAWALRGYERLMMDFVEDPDRAEHILDIPYRYHLAAATALVMSGVDMIWIGDDVGAQNAMLISPRLWGRFLKPRMATFITEIKRRKPGLKVAYHSDGNIYPIIPDLIEVGVDVLNPVQPASMDPVRLKSEFGDRLCFWGSIDEQNTLPFGAPEKVRAEVLERIRTLGSRGGLILGPTHHVQLDTPMENFWAMVNTIAGTPCRAVPDPAVGTVPVDLRAECGR
jgi:uroporphyrinogen decarboxylase